MSDFATLAAINSMNSANTTIAVIAEQERYQNDPNYRMSVLQGEEARLRRKIERVWIIFDDGISEQNQGVTA